ncbi:MAG: hypothetical protein GY750_03580 [Lentisphaerae bacterium]|nr:hypothetical protein [Lentisphaerota bacterium]MCP4100499.1 hypothetical protein [Lentisphaerota bacterium]
MGREFIGQRAVCSKCQEEFTIPAVSEDGPPARARKKAKATAIKGIDQALRMAHGEKEDIICWCKECGQKYRLWKTFAGKKAECTRCGHMMQVPLKSETSAAQKPKGPKVKPLKINKPGTGKQKAFSASPPKPKSVHHAEETEKKQAATPTEKPEKSKAPHPLEIIKKREEEKKQRNTATLE